MGIYMKAETVLIGVLAALLLLPLQAFADSIDISVVPETLSVEVNRFTSFQLSITNSMGLEDNFVIYVDGPVPYWRQPTALLLKIRHNETGLTELQFLPTKWGEYYYEAVVSSLAFPNISTRRGFTLIVTPPEVSILDIRTVVQDDLRLVLDMKASQPVLINMTFLIESAEGTFSREVQALKRVEGSETIEAAIPLIDFFAGRYKVTALADSSRAVDEFYIEPVHNVELKKTVSNYLLYDEVAIEATNNGNIVEKDFVINEDMNPGISTGFVTRPQSCTSEPDITCSFVIGEIEPRQTKRVVYRYQHWPSFAQFLAGGFVAAVLVFAGYRKQSRPTIRKRHIRKSAGMHHIILEVRNPAKHLKNVIVRDFVTPLAQVAYEFEHAKPVVKRSEAGAELIWKLGSLSPKEHRFLSYKIRPLVTGDLKMPRAYVRWGEAGSTKRSYSSHLLLE